MYYSSIFLYPCLFFLLSFPICYYSNSLAMEHQVSFLISKWNICGKAENVFLKIPGLSITDCVLECAIRPRCKAVNFKGRMVCELLHTDSNTEQALCAYIKKAYMVINNIPCEGCTDEQTCDLSSGQCISTECTRPVVVNGTLLGNIYSIGKMLGVRCDPGFKEMNKVSSSVCLKTRTWSNILYCVEESMTNTVTEPTVNPATESTTEPTVNPLTESTTESPTVSATESTTDPTSNPATESTTEPTVNPVTESTTELTTVQASNSAPETATVPATESTTDLKTVLTTESMTETTIVPATESTTELTTVPVTEPTTEPTTVTATESTIETTINQAETTDNCYSISAQATNEWCMANCNHIPPFCPDSFCQCG